jgi:hypothetical protein
MDESVYQGRREHRSLLLTTYLQTRVPQIVQNTQQHFDRPLTNHQSNPKEGGGVTSAIKVRFSSN